MHCNFAFFYTEGAAIFSVSVAGRLFHFETTSMVQCSPMPPTVFGLLHKVAGTTECYLSSSVDAWHRSPVHCPSTLNSNDDVFDHSAPMTFPQTHLQRLLCNLPTPKAPLGNPPCTARGVPTERQASGR